MTDATTEIEARVRAGERLGETELRQLASLDVLTLGMLADEARRRLRGTGVTFVRVFEIDVMQGWTSVAIPEGASEVRLRGLAAHLDEAVAAVASARTEAGSRVLSGFSLADIEERSRKGWGALSAILARLREAGLDLLADAPIDALDLDGDWWRVARDAGLPLLRITLDRSLGAIHEPGLSGADRVSTLLAIRRVQDAGAGFQAIAPLPRLAPVATPTTGYDDVRAVALARLALDNVPRVQVDWQQYGPKLAQVALTFGADDIDGVSADDDRDRGWRRAPVEEVRRNIVAAGLQPVERDGRYVTRPS